MIYTFYCILLW